MKRTLISFLIIIINQFGIYGQSSSSIQQELASDLARVKAVQKPDLNHRNKVIQDIDLLITVRNKVKNKYQSLDKEATELDEAVQEKLDLIRQVVGQGWVPAPSEKLALLGYKMNGQDGQSAFGYFQMGSSKENSPFDLKNDYQLLREKKFRPMYQNLMQKRGESVSQAAIPAPFKGVQGEKHFSNYVLRLLYNGKFEQLHQHAREAYRGNKQPDFYWIVSAYVGVANRHCGQNQINPTQEMRWVTKERQMWNGIAQKEEVSEGESFWIDTKLVPVYNLSSRAQWMSVLTTGSGSIERAKDLYFEIDEIFEGNACQSAAVRQLLENIIAYASDQKSVQGNYAEWQVQQYDDRFFEPAMYDRLNSYSTERGYKGELIGPEYHGQTLNRQELGTLALEKLVKLAKKMGIQEKEITRAIFEGRFNPHFEDFRLAHEGLCPKLGPEDIPLSTILLYKERGELAVGEVMPKGSNIGLLAQVRKQRWNERFGSFTSFEEIETIINGKEKKVSGKDLALRLVMRLSGINFERDFGVKPSPDLSYKELHRMLQSK